MIKLQTTGNQNPEKKIWNRNNKYYKRELKNELT